MFQNMISEFKQFKKEKESIIRQVSKVSANKKESEKLLCEKYDTKPFISRFFDFQSRNNIESIRKEIYKLDKEIAENKEEISDRYLTLKNNMVVCLISQKEEDKRKLDELEKSIKDINPIIKMVLDAKSSGEHAINFINIAIQQVQSAKMMENIDIASNNKATSLMSSSYNTNAASFISNANIAINGFKSKIYDVEKHIKDFKKNPISGCNDISFQLFVNGYYSSIVSDFMTLNTLTIAESQLNQSKDQIQNMVHKMITEHEVLSLLAGEYDSNISKFRMDFENEANAVLVQENIKM